MILARFPCVVDEVNFKGLSEATLYAKGNAGLCLQPKADTLFNYKFPASDNDNQPEITEGDEFLPGFEVRLVDVLPQPDDQRTIVAMTSIKLADSLTGALLVASINDENGETVFWKAAKFDLFTKPNSKTIVRLTLTLPDKKLFHKPLKLYVWNPKRGLIKPEWLLLVQE